MKGLWHLPGLAILVTALTINTSSTIFLWAYFGWIILLYVFKRLEIVPLIISLSLLMMFSFHIPKITPPKNDHPLLQQKSYEGTIHSPPVINKKMIRLILQEKNSKEKILVHYFFHHGENDQQKIKQLAYGAFCKVDHSINLPSSNSNPGEFNYQKYLLKQGISFETTLSSLNDLYCTGKHPLHLLFSLRNILIEYSVKAFSEETSQWLLALVLGEESFLSEEVQDLFNRWSLSHLLAISGLHVGIVMGILYVMLVKMNIITKERAQGILIIFLPIYAFLAGGAPSVWRASLMGISFLILSRGKIKYPLTDILSIIFIILIIVNPYLIYQLGFQFSFLVTLGLLLSMKWLQETKSILWNGIKISFLSQMIITPLQLHSFYFFQPLSIFLNAILVPYFSLFVIPFMFMLLLISFPLPKIATNFDSFFSFIHEIFLKLLVQFDELFNLPWVVGKIPPVVFLFYYIFFYLLMRNLEAKKKHRAFQYGLLIVCLLMGVSLKPYFSEDGYVTMLDIGQGDAFVIELPFRKGVILIDVGATYNYREGSISNRNFQQVIKPYLMSKGITKIDAIIISHEDLDHNGSVPFLLKNFIVGEVIVSEYYKFNEAEKKSIIEERVKVRRVLQNEVFTIREQGFKVLSPKKDYGDENDNSLVVYFHLGGLDWLFTGDISKTIEKKILANDPTLRTDVLKIAHHGSQTSTDSAFLDSLVPEYVYIPVGRNNRYGHPNEQVIEKLEKRQIDIFRTDEHGAVQYMFKKGRGTFKTFLP